MSPVPKKLPSFSVFKSSDAHDISEVPVVRWTPPGEVGQRGWEELVNAGYNDGHETKILFCAPGFSLTHVWFKSGIPLPRHSHDCDCLYYITAGSLRLGNQILGAGDGFFVGENVPYSYVPGEDGVEVLEFRATNSFDIKFLAENPDFWKRAVETAESRKATWAEEVKPSLERKP